MAGVRVDGRVLLDEGCHVGDGHQNFHLLIRQGLRHRQLVQVQGIIVVNGCPKQVAQVYPGRFRPTIHWLHRLQFPKGVR